MCMFLVLCFVAIHYVFTAPVQLVPSQRNYSKSNIFSNTALKSMIQSKDFTSEMFNSEPNVLSSISKAALKSMYQSKNFISEMSLLDPNALSSIIELLRGLVQTNQDEIDLYATEESAALILKNSLSQALGEFDTVLRDTQNEETRIAAKKIIDQGNVDTATVTLQEATDDHTAKLNRKTSQTTILSTEIATLNNVIAQLNGLSNAQTQYPTASPTSTADLWEVMTGSGCSGLGDAILDLGYNLDTCKSTCIANAECGGFVFSDLKGPSHSSWNTRCMQYKFSARCTDEDEQAAIAYFQHLGLSCCLDRSCPNNSRIPGALSNYQTIWMCYDTYVYLPRIA